MDINLVNVETAGKEMMFLEAVKKYCRESTDSSFIATAKIYASPRTASGLLSWRVDQVMKDDSTVQVTAEQKQVGGEITFWS
jgi:hypothetical protein